MLSFFFSLPLAAFKKLDKCDQAKLQHRMRELERVGALTLFIGNTKIKSLYDKLSSGGTDLIDAAAQTKLFDLDWLAPLRKNNPGYLVEKANNI